MVRKVILALALVSAASLPAQVQRFDILITGARVVDGSGSPWYFADVGIQGDTISAIGRLGDATAFSGRLHGVMRLLTGAEGGHRQLFGQSTVPGVEQVIDRSTERVPRTTQNPC